jgi:hypothetical protein
MYSGTAIKNELRQYAQYWFSPFLLQEPLAVTQVTEHWGKGITTRHLGIGKYKVQTDTEPRGLRHRPGP